MFTGMKIQALIHFLRLAQGLLTGRLVGKRRKKLISNKTWHLLKSGEEVWYFPEQWLGDQWEMCWYHRTISNLASSNARHHRTQGPSDYQVGTQTQTVFACFELTTFLGFCHPSGHPRISTSFIPKDLDQRGFSMAGGDKSCSPARAQQEGWETKRTTCCAHWGSPQNLAASEMLSH